MIIPDIPALVFVVESVVAFVVFLEGALVFGLFEPIVLLPGLLPEVLDVFFPLVSLYPIVVLTSRAR